MIKFLDANKISKLDLKITTAGLYTECENCKNSFAVGNSDGFLREVREALENSLIHNGIDEKGIVELNYCFECPACFRRKFVPLEFKLETEKTLLIFGTKISKNAEFLAKSRGVFENQIKNVDCHEPNGSRNDGEKDKK